MLTAAHAMVTKGMQRMAVTRVLKTHRTRVILGAITTMDLIEKQYEPIW